ncbi:porin [Xylophilus rhododendri]|uniref:Porin n=1 Tax=Xylophilus rhododendri TaxID=2697032 RepID=A0A857J4A9_9BURK|nr:porin [Xylophilus rhododendri]QHI98497.1 porin [Xylophilus rhododendri]
MKAFAIGAVAAAASFAAAAQSSVTLFGVVDAGVARVSATGKGHVDGLMTGGNYTSRLGFRGVEDLGGGMAASFWLEGETATDVGTSAGLNFVRRSTVSLSGRWGELRLGRDYTANYVPFLSFDVYGQRGIGTIEHFATAAGALTVNGAAASDIRNSNSVTYFLPANLGGVYGNLQYAFGERSSSTVASATASKKQGNYAGASLGYASGPLNIGGGYGNFSDVSRAAAYLTDYSIGSLGASYDFGFIKPIFLYQTERADGKLGQPDFKFDTIAIALSAPFGASTVRATYHSYNNKTAGTAGNNDAAKLSLGYVYNLSKRTALYADVARLRNKGSASFVIGGLGGSVVAGAPTAGGTSTAFGVGIRHSF